MKQSKDCNIKSWQMRNPDKFVKWFHIYLYYIKQIILWLHEKLFIASFFWISFVCITTQYFHYNCQGRQDGLRRTLRDTVKQCFINPHHICIYIYVGGKGFQGSTGSGKYKMSTHAPLPHSSQVIPRLRRDHDNNTTKLKNML